ncbi:MAG TPA: hypothetical protein VNL15_06970 [Dehalococcoidia bacterium]|nr:hypothetical protein [Dehalococcoidia bacterium]
MDVIHSLNPLQRPCFFLFAFLAALLIGATGVARAESEPPLRRSVGNYELTVGYASSPPLLEVKNALHIEVRELANSRPVSGLERSLQVTGEVNVESVTRPLSIFLRPVSDQPGVYEGVFVPPSLGDYRFRVTGNILGTPVDEVFSDGPGGLPKAEVAEDDFTSQGALIAVASVVAFLIGLGIIAFLQIRMRRRPQPSL